MSSDLFLKFEKMCKETGESFPKTEALNFSIERTKNRLLKAIQLEKVNSIDVDECSTWPTEVWQSCLMEAILYQKTQLNPIKQLEYANLEKNAVARLLDLTGEYLEHLGSLSGHPFHPCAKYRQLNKATSADKITTNDIIQCSPELNKKIEIYLWAH